MQEVTTGQQVTSFSRTASGTVAGQLTGKTPGEMVSGFSIEIKRPYLWLADGESASLMSEGDHLQVNGKHYRIAAGPIVFDAEFSSSFCKVLLEAID